MPQESMHTAFRQNDHGGWLIRDSGPEDAGHTVLLLPGALATAAFYDDLLADPTIRAASIRFLATTLPGFGGTPEPEDISMEGYAAAAATIASEFGCDAVVGHSLGANVAIEMALAGMFSGSLVLISPSFSRADESKFPRALDLLSRVLGAIPYRLMLRIIGPAMKNSLPPHRREALIGELKKNEPRFLQRQTRDYLGYLDRRGALAPLLCNSGTPAWVVFGDHDDIGLADTERAQLENCSSVTLITITDTGHFTLNEKPAEIASILLKALGYSRQATG
jgi:pimeloyl-ACP methyl ester carboxylesterase